MPRSLLALYAVRLARGTALRSARIGWVGLMMVVLGLHVAWAWEAGDWDPHTLGDRLFAQVREMHLLFAVLLGPAWAAGTSMVSDDERDLWRMSGRGAQWATVVPVAGLLALDLGFVPLAMWVDIEGRAAWEVCAALLFPAGLLVVHAGMAVRLALSGFRMAAAALWTVAAGAVAWVVIPAWASGTWDLAAADATISPVTASLGDPRGLLSLVPLLAASIALFVPSPLDRAPRAPWIVAILLGLAGGWWWLVQVAVVALVATVQPVPFPRFSWASRPPEAPRPRRAEIGRWRSFLLTRLSRSVRGTLPMWVLTAVFLASFLLWWKLPGNALRMQEIPIGLYLLAVGLAAGTMAAADVSDLDAADHVAAMRLAGVPPTLEAVSAVFGAWIRCYPWLALGGWLMGHSLVWIALFAWAEVALTLAAVRRGVAFPAVVLVTLVFGVLVSIMGGATALDDLRSALVPVLIDGEVPWRTEVVSGLGWGAVAVAATAFCRR